MKLLVACAFGLEAIVKRELQGLGYEARVVSPGKLAFEGDARALVRANLWLRTADRVLVEMGRFQATDFDTLFETTRGLNWSGWIAMDGAFPVVGRSHQSQLSSVPACQRAVKKAIVDSLQRECGGKELSESGATFKVEIALLKDEATLTLDTTGPSLHKRGYRQQGAQAPLKETLAAAMVLLSFWKPERPFLDPFCGSGTIPIEAAMWARNIAPGRHRSFASEEWARIPAQLWKEERERADTEILPELSERLIGCDRDFRVLRHARSNADNAGVGNDIHFQEREFAATTSKRKYGVLITNPPYGERIGMQDEVLELYRSFPEVLRKLPTWSHFILAAAEDFEAIVRRSADRRRKVYNGRIECTYYQYHGPKAPRRQHPDSDAQTDVAATVDAKHKIVAQATRSTPSAHRKETLDQRPVFGGLTTKGREQAELFSRRLTKRARHFRRWPVRQGISCFRLYERDIPEIPLVVDRYEDHLHITEYDRPHDRDPGQHADWLDLMVTTACEALELPRSHAFLKRRQRQRGAKQHDRIDEQNYELIIKEGGLRFIVNLSDYVDTGLFLDHRITRSFVRKEVDGKRFLNLFAYTGAFSVYAAAGNASETVTVDWSNTYLDWAKRNMRLNEFENRSHQFVREDSLAYVRKLPRVPQFDVAVVDPPTFSNSKRTEMIWDVQRDHVVLLNELLDRLTPGGVIYFSNNFRRFKLEKESLKSDKIFEISRQTVPEDFRNRRVHRCWRIFAKS